MIGDFLRSISFQGSGSSAADLPALCTLAAQSVDSGVSSLERQSCLLSLPFLWIVDGKSHVCSHENEDEIDELNNKLTKIV